MISFEVVSYRNSTSNHNHQAISELGKELYLIEILHQTTTYGRQRVPQKCCILSKFYIKPQQRVRHKIGHSVVSYRNSTSNHNRKARISVRDTVVSYRNSTSNHNPVSSTLPSGALYLIEILHQTTTISIPCVSITLLYLIEILHQTTTIACTMRFDRRCILSKFYIKPQPYDEVLGQLNVVSYRNSTSNHNGVNATMSGSSVVSYRNSTSNHNLIGDHATSPSVVSYRNSTSNHNNGRTF